MAYKAGFVALIGRPNVGKSTLLNAILHQKVAIVSPKPQTTRDNIRGILTTEEAQIIFIDTPGIHQAREKLAQSMVERAYAAIDDVDVIVMVVDGTRPLNKGDAAVLNAVKDTSRPKFLVVNKIDKLNKGQLLQYLDGVDQDAFDEIIPLSALNDDNVSELIRTIIRYLPEDVQYYPADMVADYPESFMIRETIREKLLQFIAQEVPHAAAVQVEEVTRRPQVIYIRAAIVVEKQSQKAIVIGKGGQMIRRISTAAREELEQKLQAKVYLETFVRVEADWRNRPSELKEFGYLNEGKHER